MPDSLREQIELKAVSILGGDHQPEQMRAIADLVLEHRAQEAERCIPFDKPSQFKVRARELRAMENER